MRNEESEIKSGPLDFKLVGVFGIILMFGKMV